MAQGNQSAVRFHFHKFRDHQQKIWANGGGTRTTDESGRIELSYGSAPYGEHAKAAYTQAKAHVHFLDRHRREDASRLQRALRRMTP